MTGKSKEVVNWLIKTKWLLSLLAAIFLAGGICARYLISHNQPLKEAAGALFDALFIATFLAIAVDPILKQLFFREATKDIFSFIYGYSLPPELRSFVNDVILKETVIRRQCCLKWTIQSIRDNADKVALLLDASFSVENFTNENRKYEHKVVAWSDSPTDVGSVEDLYCQDQVTHKQQYHIKKGDFKVDAEGYIHGKEINLPPKGTNSAPLYRMGAHYYSESGASGLDQFTFFETTVDVEVVVTVDDGLQELMFSISPQLEGVPDKIKPELDGASGTYRCCWAFKKVFVQNETIVIRWQPTP
ncbi:MAG: hypothetical protein V4587_19835 [Acidobacteriota bacterium]